MTSLGLRELGLIRAMVADPLLGQGSGRGRTECQGP